MHAVNLLPPKGDLKPSSAAQWVAAMLSQAEALQTFDEELDPLTDEGAAFERAHQLRAEWSRWVDDAESLLARLRESGMSNDKRVESRHANRFPPRARLQRLRPNQRLLTAAA